MAELTVSIVTPEESVISTDAIQVTAPSIMGEVGILPNHKPLLANMEEGVVGFHAADGVEYFAVSGGFLEVSQDRLTVLAEAAERAASIDVERADAAIKEANKLLESLTFGSEEHSEQLARIRRANNRLNAAKLASH